MPRRQCRDIHHQSAEDVSTSRKISTLSRHSRGVIAVVFTDVQLCSAMGKSRSATVVCAYLMHQYGISPSEALSQIRESRPFCEPNDGFMKQLDLYQEVSATDHIDDTPAYQRWLYQREVELSRACGQAPEADKIRFEDEHVDNATCADFELRCRKCRLVSYWSSSPSPVLIDEQTSTRDIAVHLPSPTAAFFWTGQRHRRFCSAVSSLRSLFPRSVVMDAA